MVTSRRSCCSASARAPAPGRATLAATEESKRPRRRGARAKAKVVVIGSAPITIAAGQTATVQIALDRAGRSLLAADHGAVAATLSVKGTASGAAVSVSEPVRLKR